jgi:hypothetical protein
LWVLSFALGGTMGSVLGNAISSLLSAGGGGSVGSVIGNFVWGAILGLANWLVLYRYMKNIVLWPILTGVGLALGTVLASTVLPTLFPGVQNLSSNDPLTLLSDAANGAAIGLVIGLAQATLLVRRVSDTWGVVTFVLTGALGWLGLIVLDFLLLSVVSGGTSTNPVLSIAILLLGFALAGTISGYELPSLLTKHQNQILEENKPDARAPAARSN